MKPTEFPEQTTVFGKNQTQYKPLPAHDSGTCVTTRWELTWRERFKILFSGVLWIQQLRFGIPLQPIKPTIEKPEL